MKNIRTAIPIIVLALAIALGPGVASAQEGGTIKISSTFYMDSLSGTVGPDLATVFTNGHDHTWTLMLYGTSQSRQMFTNPFGVTSYATEIHATSFNLEFVGPDAATLNGIVSGHIAGGDVFIYLENSYSSGIGNDFAVMFVEPKGSDFWFLSDCDTFGCATLFPTNAAGYPVVGPAPFSILAEYSALLDNRPGNDGYIQSRASLVTFVYRPSVRLEPVSPQQPGGFQFLVRGDAGLSVRVQRSTNLRDWADWQTLTLGATPSALSDPDVSTKSHRFYRTVTP